MASTLEISPLVRQALADAAPVVALESTVIAHGLPYPANLETARRMEEVVREHGALPATIAILDGVLRVGLGEGDLPRLMEEVRDIVASALPVESRPVD